MGKHYFKNRLKHFLPLAGFIFGLFLFLLPGGSEAECSISCGGILLGCGTFETPYVCQWGKVCASPVCPQSERIGIIGTINNPGDLYFGGYYGICDLGDSVQDGYCTSSDGKCKINNFPTGNNGQNCTARDRCSPFPLVCNDCAKTGVWDASESKCVSCNGKIEQYIRGDTTAIYAGCSGFPSGCNSEGNAGDGQCESACTGTDSQCDEATYGSDVPVSGGKCNNCVFTPGPAIGFSPTSFTFTAGYGGSNPTNQGLQIWNSGPSGSTLHWSVSRGSASWLNLSPTSGISTGSSDKGTVWLSVNISGLTYGTYSATITISDSNATNSPRTVPVTLIIGIPNLQVPSDDIMLGTTDGKVHYTVHNAGNWYSPEAGFYNSLYINGVYTDYQLWGYSLAAGAWTMELIFPNWICTPYQTSSIKICADERNGASKMVTESNESDNCTTVSLLCPLECTGSIDASPETATAPCDYSIRIYNVDYCQNLTWQVTRDGSPIDSGTVTSNTNWTKTLNDYDLGVDSSINYRLYIDNDLKDNDIVICQEGVPTTCTEAGGACKASTCSTYTSCSSAATNYDCTGTTPYCCIGGCTTPSAFDFSISVSPASGSVAQGSPVSPSPTVSTTLTSGTTQSVTFSSSISPSEPTITRSFNPVSCNPSCSSTMTINTSATTPAGTYQITVCGTNPDSTVVRCFSYYTLTVTSTGAVINPPSVTTNPATNVFQTSVTLNGTLNNMGNAPTCYVWFEYWLKPGADCTPKPASPTVIVPDSPFMASIGSFSKSVSGLISNTIYCFEAYAKNGGSW